MHLTIYQFDSLSLNVQNIQFILDNNENAKRRQKLNADICFVKWDVGSGIFTTLIMNRCEIAKIIVAIATGSPSEKSLETSTVDLSRFNYVHEQDLPCRSKLTVVEVVENYRTNFTSLVDFFR